MVRPGGLGMPVEEVIFMPFGSITYQDRPERAPSAVWLGKPAEHWCHAGWPMRSSAGAGRLAGRPAGPSINHTAGRAGLKVARPAPEF